MVMYNTYTHRVQLMAKFAITLVFSCVPLIKLVGCFEYTSNTCQLCKYCSCVFTDVW